MKHHIAVKFLAVMLCAAFLLTAVGTGIGALCLTEAKLYEQTPKEVYDESRDELAAVFARQVASNYLSQTLGGCPEAITDNYVHFSAGYYSYALKDPEGNVLKSREADVQGEGTKYAFDIDTQYMKLIETTPVSQLYVTHPTEAPTYGDLHITDNCKPNDARVDEIIFHDRYGNATSYHDENLGILYHIWDDTVYFQALDPSIRLPGEEVVYAAFFFEGALSFDISCSEGIGDASVDENGLLRIIFRKENTVTTVYDEEYEVYDAVPQDGADVKQIHVTFYDGSSESCGAEGDGILGAIRYRADGTLQFTGIKGNDFLSNTGPVSKIAFIGIHGNLLYEATAQSGGIVGEFYWNGECIEFRSFLSHMETSNIVDDTSVPMTEAPIANTEAPTESSIGIPTRITDNTAQLDVHVSTITIFDTEKYTTSNKKLSVSGHLLPNANGTVTFRSYAPMEIPKYINTETLTRIVFRNTDNRVLYDVISPNGVGYFSQDDYGCLLFTTTVTPTDVEEAAAPATPTEPPTELYTEPETIPDTTTATPEVTIPVDIPEETVIVAEVTVPNETVDPRSYDAEEADYTYTHYYDHELGEEVQAKFLYEPVPEGYTVELILYPGAYEMDHVYDLIVWIWGYRTQLLYLLGTSLFGFAVTAVYLCCTAGRKKGQAEPRAAGLNAMSLDLYLGAGGLVICGLAVAGFEGGYYLLRYSPQNLVPFTLIMGYAAALIIVGFCFACAAQFKTPGGYWWRNTLVFRCMKLGILFLRWAGKAFIRFMQALEQFLDKAFPTLGKLIALCWRTFLRLCLAAYRYTEMGLTWLYNFIGKIFRKVAAWMHAFLVMLPVTWQWLITGGMLLFVLVMAVLTRTEFFIMLSILAGIALVVYGSHCFGVLLDSTKRMGKGDLETKVDDKLMIGAFKEFAGDLNDLADVAVIAAQKQLKSERMKTELITNVSHDIKTPLTSIINYVDLLQKPHTDEEQETYLEVLSRQSQQMKKLLEDLIEMSKASTGNMTVNITRINAVEAVNQAMGEFADKLEKAQLTPMVHQSEEVIYMQADGRLAWRVLSNLLSNAVKYALPGTRVYIDVTQDSGNVLISMKNISREALNVSADELMERFVRGDASRNTEGSGLGLNIAQSLMEIQKGKLQLLVDGDLFKVTLIFPSA